SALLPTLLALPDRTEALAMAGATLDAMAAGGIHDQLGGGFHRYAVDGRWLVPHFEKMLYDNALLASAYAAGAAVLGEPAFADGGRELAAFLLGPLSAPDGRLLRTFRAGTAKIGGFADDYGAVAHGLIALHAATGELGYLEEARRLTALALELFDD